VQGNFTLFGVLTTAVDLQIQQFNSEFTLQFGEDKAHPALGKSVRDTVVSSLKTAKSAAIDGINYRCGTTACFPSFRQGTHNNGDASLSLPAHAHTRPVCSKAEAQAALNSATAELNRAQARLDVARAAFETAKAAVSPRRFGSWLQSRAWCTPSRRQPCQQPSAAAAERATRASRVPVIIG
jgi:hypothetical protein